MSVMISFIVPIVRPQPLFDELLRSLASCCGDNKDCQLVLINQTKSSLEATLKSVKFPVVEVITTELIAASRARNLGANVADGEYLFFLDDDAKLIATPDEMYLLKEFVRQGLGVGVCHRGEIIDGNYVTHWPTFRHSVNQFNFHRFVIEWNIVVNKKLFLKFGGFPDIGPGSKHAALCGEAFLFAAKLIGNGIKINAIDFIRVAHPSLVKRNNTQAGLLGYFFGAGYAVGASLKYFPRYSAMYWLVRGIAAAFSDYIIRYKKYIDSTHPKISHLRFKLLVIRLRGLMNGLNGKPVLSQEWLTSYLDQPRL